MIKTHDKDVLKMINAEMILKAISNNTISFVVDPLSGRGTVAQIGDNPHHFFYFGGFCVS